MFKFNPDPIDELSGTKLKEGSASFKIIDAADTDKQGFPMKSRAGNAMMKITFRVTDSSGNQGLLNDYFIATQPWKISKLLKAVSRSHWYNNGMLAPSDLKGLSGMCMLKSDPTPEYPENMKIGSYTERDQAETLNSNDSQDLSTLDDIPF